MMIFSHRAGALAGICGHRPRCVRCVSLMLEAIELGGGTGEAEIARAVKKADIFVAVYTGDQKHVYDYCGFEVGLFTAS